MEYCVREDAPVYQLCVGAPLFLGFGAIFTVLATHSGGTAWWLQVAWWICGIGGSCVGLNAYYEAYQKLSIDVSPGAYVEICEKVPKSSGLAGNLLKSHVGQVQGSEGGSLITVQFPPRKDASGQVLGGTFAIRKPILRQSTAEAFNAQALAGNSPGAQLTATSHQPQPQWMQHPQRGTQPQMFAQPAATTPAAPSPAGIEQLLKTRSVVPVFDVMEGSTRHISILQAGQIVRVLAILADSEGKMKVHHEHGWSPLRSPSGQDVFDDVGGSSTQTTTAAGVADASHHIWPGHADPELMRHTANPLGGASPIDFEAQLTSKITLHEFLGAHKLSQYHEQLEAMGVTKIDHLLDMEESDYAQAGLTRIEVRRVLRVLSELSCEPKVIQI